MGIAALSSKAANGLQNGYKYNGIAEEDNFDLDLYDAYYRTLDPQIGRWWQTDPYNEFASPYLSMGNNPVNYTDPSGSFVFSDFRVVSHGIWAVGGAVIGAIIGNSVSGKEGPLQGLAIGGGTGLGASFVNWGNVAGALGNAGIWIGNLFGSNQFPLLVGESIRNELYGNDFSHGYNGKISGMENIPENKLINGMRTLMNHGTTLNSGMKRVANTMVDKFINNKGGYFQDNVLNQTVEQSLRFTAFKTRIGYRINQEMKRVNGKINRFAKISFNNLAFNSFYDKLNGLSVTIDGIQNTQVYLEKFHFNKKTGDYYMRLRFDLYDTFGLDSEDIKNHPYKGFKEWWLLQYKYNHLPFITKIQLYEDANLNIHTNYKNPYDE